MTAHRMLLGLATSSLLACSVAALIGTRPGSAQPMPTPAPPTPTASTAPEMGPASATPSAVPAIPAPTAFPSPTASPVPTPTSSPWGFVYLVPRATNGATATPVAGAPEILEFDLNAEPIVTPSDIRGRIVTSPEVVSVTVHVLGYNQAVPKVSPGTFAMEGHAPSIPFFLAPFIRGTKTLEIVATVADGRTATISLPIHIR